MMPLRRFAIHQPRSVREAAEMLAQYGESGRLYAGGTELLLAMKHDLLRYEHLVDVKTISGLDKIEIKNASLSVGGSATHRAIERSSLAREHFPVLTEMESKVANVRVRASGTLGGNLCFAEPHSDPATLLVALNATVRVQGRGNERTMTVNELLRGAYETALTQDELLTAVEIPLPEKSRRAAYVKFQIHERPTLGLALVLDLDDSGWAVKGARAVVGSISPRPCRSEKAEELLVGSIESVKHQLAEAGKALSDAAEPVDDLEGSAEYKRHLVNVFLFRAFDQALATRRLD
ncbi:MAG: xanthine dehydrogenase family protein subunit M [Deltaproteobacteria bacterium]|nr:xanthine dehydrogenase family protein subunit M [Deltaproteobacteria bacterium]